MEDSCKKVLEHVGISTDSLHGQFIPREILLDNQKYEQLKSYIPELKKHFSSSSLTCLQKTAKTKQKWPLLNLVRQILLGYKFELTPLRKSNGYTKEGVKIYLRYFVIQEVV